ncbi:hypothetical protein RUM43_010699 [Polyplax serrata]|uniref:tRNA N(3)-methylcytidine methyltransferase n=1 Tax=Polyplax serrata TaxID=468196 RepID=A0AAN8PAV5_POLSC
MGEQPITTMVTDLLLELSEDDKSKLKHQDSRLVSPFQAMKLELYAQKFWDQFYKRNTTKFFKDRHWTLREFHELVDNEQVNRKTKILEVGCGVGNLIFPLMEEENNFEIFACDFSPRAVEFVKNHELYNPQRLKIFQADVTKDDLLEHTSIQMDLITVVFVLSAIHPDKFRSTVKNLYNVLKPGGLVLIRDYGMYDMTQIRFKAGHKISENFYMRQDGTRSYFFTCEKLRELFVSEGFEEVLCCYIKSRTINKKEGVDVPRTFVQAKFRK